MKNKTLIYAISFLTLILCISIFQYGKESKMNYTLNITHLTKYESLDPIHADNSVNLLVARMLYLTPIEITSNNHLTSQILDRFVYDTNKKEITLTVKSGSTFSDGSPIEVEDVAMAILRFAAYHPTFPVIKKIQGIAEWALTQNPLETFPSGFKVTGSTIRLQLDQPDQNPLFRFCLEVFSIVPAKCIDRKTMKMSCKTPPTSGNYTITSEDESHIQFQLRTMPRSHEEHLAPDRITFVYHFNSTLKKVLENTHLSGVVFGLSSATAFDSINLEGLGFQTLRTPQSSFFSIAFNPKVSGFEHAECRRQFADAFMRARKKRAPALNFSRSLFAPIVPGFLSNEVLNPLEPKSLDCFKDYKNRGLNWATYKSFSSDWKSGAFAEAAKELNIKLNDPILVETFDEMGDLFLKGQTPFATFSSGFWPLDPVGDLQMMFTPGLHKMLTFVSNKNEYREILAKLSVATDTQVQSIFSEFNRQLNFDSLVQPINHVSTFFASKDNSLREYLPYAVQEPYPWQVFRRE